MDKIQEMRSKILELNRYRRAYYNRNQSLVSNAEYDAMFEELEKMERETGIVYADSPTQHVGYYPEGKLEKIRHPVPLLSLDKTKEIQELKKFAKKNMVLLMLKLDGLTIKLTYEKGRLLEAATRGDGETGENVLRNVPFIKGIPVTIPYQKRLVLSGEAFIRQDDFKRLQEVLRDENGEAPKNGRNLASGSVQSSNPKHCQGRCVRFMPFNVLEGLEEIREEGRGKCLSILEHMGFSVCPYIYLEPERSNEETELWVQHLKTAAERKNIPIDGIVAIYDSYRYSESLGRTERFYRNGLAFKFEDESYETVLREISWTPSRSGELAPVALFDTIEIDGCAVSRATLHNLTFIKELELMSGCRIQVSKRNMIIPHVEGNLDRGNYEDTYPKLCPCCKNPTRVYVRETEKGKKIETLHCDNPGCESQILRKFVHFAEKKAMDIEGLSEAILGRFLSLGWISCFQDLYYLRQYRKKIIHMEGFGEKSYEKLIKAIEDSRNTDFAHYLTAMDIPMIGRTKSRELSKIFHNNLDAFEEAASGDYDFSKLEDFGETLNRNIHTWFADEDNRNQWRDLQIEMIFHEEDIHMAERKDNPFSSCVIVATGKLQNFTRDGIHNKILELGGIPGNSVTRKTNYLICGEKAGSKLAKAKQMGIPILSEEEFLQKISSL